MGLLEARTSVPTYFALENITALNVQFKKIYIPPLRKVNGNSKGEGMVKAKVFKEKYESQ